MIAIEQQLDPTGDPILFCDDSISPSRRSRGILDAVEVATVFPAGVATMIALACANCFVASSK